MAISEKTRKILWGRSGNRCALCRRELVVDATADDDESVVGDECHLVSGKANGPRFDHAFPVDCLDEPDNLILLCRVHHKMVDDQCETYTVDTLKGRRAKHEQWVSSRLAPQGSVPPVRIRCTKDGTPAHLVRLTTGREVGAIIGDACGYSFHNDEPESEAEVELLAAFLQEAQDWGDLWGELEAGDRVKTAHRLGTLLRELEEAGFLVFGGREIQVLEGGITPPSSFPVAILRVLRASSPEIATESKQPAAGTGTMGNAARTPRQDSDVEHGMQPTARSPEARRG